MRARNFISPICIFATPPYSFREIRLAKTFHDRQIVVGTTFARTIGWWPTVSSSAKATGLNISVVCSARQHPGGGRVPAGNASGHRRDQVARRKTDETSGKKSLKKRNVMEEWYEGR